MNKSKTIVIGIPTFKRPQGLARLLASIAAQQAPFVPQVLVADNEGEQGAGLGVVEEIRRQGFPFPLTAVAVPERGISQVRNALMKHAFEHLGADALAMVDDDELVEPGWIAALVDMQAQGNFDVVGGTVYPEFETDPPRWSERLAIYWRPVHPGGGIDMIHGTTNVLLHRSVHERFPDTFFDASFALTGGGDKEFFTRLRRKGAVFGYAADAVSHEFFDAGRATKNWALKRAYRIGSGDARIFKKHAPTFGEWAKEMAKFTAALVLSPVLILAMAWSPSKHMRPVLMLARQLGKINGLLGKPPKVYEIIHGK
jgi:succinoglycan biosynthesis protein ExoM